jgi:hypothetical protein
MRTAGAGLFVALALAYLLSGILPGAVRDPVFSRVWIERNTTDDVFYRTPDRTNGGLGLTAVTAAQLLQRAYPFEVYDIEGLPDWSWTERYDVRAGVHRAGPGCGRRVRCIGVLGLATHVRDRRPHGAWRAPG